MCVCGSPLMPLAVAVVGGCLVKVMRLLRVCVCMMAGGQEPGTNINRTTTAALCLSVCVVCAEKHE